MTYCGAKTRAGGACKRPAGWGTQHVGEGRCKLHGGASTGRPIVVGRYSLAHRKSLEAKARAFIDDPQPGNLLGELALMRALLQEYLDRFDDQTRLPFDDIARMFEMMEAIGRLVERIAKIVAATSLTQNDIKHLQERFTLALLTYIPDADTRLAVLRFIFEDSGAVVPSDGARFIEG